MYLVALSADGTVLAIGAPYQNGGPGYVRVHDWDGALWVQRSGDLGGDSTGDRFGRAVALSADGSVLAIGAPLSSNSRGYARVFDWNGAQWVRRSGDLDGDGADDRNGESVALSADGSVVAVGAWYRGTTKAAPGACACTTGPTRRAYTQTQRCGVLIYLLAPSVCFTPHGESGADQVCQGT